VLVPWIVRNWRVFGAYVPVSTNGGRSFYASNHPESDGLGGAVFRDIVLPEDRRLAADGCSEPERSDYFFRKGVAAIRADAGRAAALFARKFMLFWDVAAENYVRGVRRRGYNYGYAFLVPPAMLAIVLAWRKREWSAEMTLSILVVLFFTVVHAIGHSCTRYRISLEPMLILLAADGLVRLFRTVRARTSVAIVGAMVLLHLVVFVAFNPVVERLKSIM
jgi:hypothetical protein